MPEIIPIGLRTAERTIPVGQLVVQSDAPQRASVGAPRSAMAFQYDDAWLRHGFSLGADLPLVSGVLRVPQDVGDVDPVLKARAGRFGFVCDHAPGKWLSRLVESVQINGLKLDLDELPTAPSQLWARAGHAGHRFSSLALPLSPSNQTTFSPVLLDARKQKERMKTARELARACEVLALGGTLRTSREAELLLAAASDIGGASPKALVAMSAGSYSERVLRFFQPSSGDIAPGGLGLDPCVSVVAGALAARCGIKVVGSELLSDIGFLEERFDRTPEGVPLLALSAATLVSRRRTTRARPRAYPAGYLDVADILNREGAHPADDLRELFARLLFNSLVGNRRDRLDHFWFTREAAGWKLLPMYAPTVCPALSGNRCRQLSTPLAGSNTLVAPEDAVSLARYFGLKPAQAKTMCLEFRHVVSGWRSTAQELGIDYLSLARMAPIFEQ